MRLTTALLSFIGVAAAAPVLDVRTDPTWTLHNFIRTCDDTQNVCGYSFTIVPSASPSIQCLFYDYVKPTEPSPLRSARFSSPSNLPCGPNSPVFINIGYNQPGNFWVVVPVNTATKKMAFFGYNALEMVDYTIVSPDHTSPEQGWGTAKRDAIAEPEALQEPPHIHKAIEARADLGIWAVKKLVRNCAASQCDYTFEIHRSVGGGPIICSLSAPGNNQQSFAAVPCSQNANWKISWGFNAQYGFAVMTAVSTSQSQNAWFGFNNVLTVSSFPDSGPNPVYAI